MKDNYNHGWIGLYRSISSHWLYPQNRAFTKFEAWVDLLLQVNHTDKKAFNGYDITMCERGEVITSQKKLMLKWGWSKSKLIKFLEVLKSDLMIDFKSDTKKTTIRVLNYTDYQDFKKVEDIKKDHKKTVESLQKDFKKTVDELTERLQKATNNNVNNLNNKNKGESKENTDFIPEKIPLSLRKEKFQGKLINIEGDEGEKLKFLEYWTATNEFKKMRFEDDPYFNIGTKFKSWIGQAKNLNYGSKPDNKKSSTFLQSKKRDYSKTSFTN